MHRWLAIILLNTALLQGAPVKELPWSFLPLKEQALPKVQKKDWPQQRMDHFILAGIEAQNLQPATPADDRVLLRRLYFDLIGLPPTPKQLTDFRKRTEADRLKAIETEINTLLASPHYGERWARHWLDLARYTDKTDSWLNSTASAWRYRDWVVGALNRDLPYNQFVKLQLTICAGCLVTDDCVRSLDSTHPPPRPGPGTETCAGPGPFSLIWCINVHDYA